MQFGADSNIDSNVIAHPAARAILHNLKLQGQNAMTRAGPELTRKRSPVGSGDGEEVRTKKLLSCHPAGRVVAPDLYIRPARDGV